MKILNIASYRFVSIDPRRFRDTLYQQCEQLGLKGTILLAPEGINLFLAGAEADVRKFCVMMDDMAPFAGLDYKESWSAEQPFGRLRVKIKKEIIPFGWPEIDPARAPGKAISPATLKQWLDEGRDVILLDTRNQYEVEIGTFEKAVNPGIRTFREFVDAARQLPEEVRHKPVVAFCTGGIRCEKAVPALAEMGFDQVYQLEGGILRYFETVGGAHWQGSCFVFDERVALTPDLKAVAASPAQEESASPRP